MFSFWKALRFLLLGLATLPALASTWYVRPDGGTRYSEAMPQGQCDGTADAPYPGSGKNRQCAFKDVRSFWMDGSYNSGKVSTAWGWIGTGGDTYLIHGSLATGATYRLGWNNPAKADDAKTGLFYGVAGDPYQPAMLPPPSGTPDHHTRILGENYASCHAASAKTQFHGGYATSVVLNLRDASYVDVACLDITDFSGCGSASQPHRCDSSLGSLSDSAGTGVSWTNKSTHDTLTDVHIHGLAGSGMSGPTGDGVVLRYVDLIGNAGAGWNADLNNGTTGTGDLRVEHFNFSWNGCAEEYPLVHPLPYNECTDDNSGGYGDGFGTASTASSPAWHVSFDHGVVSYNTQDGLDALHIEGAGSTMSVSHTLAYGNMGQQIKVGGASGTLTNNQIVTNCNAMRQRIPGTPGGYNAKLSDFCRAADAGIAIMVNNHVPLKVVGNTIYSASVTTVEVDCGEPTCTAAARIDFRDNLFLGFRNDPAHGYANGGRGEMSNYIYIGADSDPFKNAGSTVTGNVAYFPTNPAHCTPGGEAKVVCRDPHLTDETWHNYGYGDMTPRSGSAALVDVTAITPDAPVPAAPDDATTDLPLRRFHRPRLRVLGACAGALALVAWGLTRSRQA